RALLGWGEVPPSGGEPLLAYAIGEPGQQLVASRGQGVQLFSDVGNRFAETVSAAWLPGGRALFGWQSDIRMFVGELAAGGNTVDVVPVRTLLDEGVGAEERP